MKRIAIDMDGVLADVYSQFVKMHKAEFGVIVSAEEMTGKPEHGAFPNLLQYVNSPGFFRHAPVMQDAVKIVQQLNEQYKVFIVSAAMEFPGSLPEKQAWLNEYFPFIGWQQMVFCGSKEIIKAEIMIDDHFKNLDYFDGETLLYTQPHNKNANAHLHKRVNNWAEIEGLLLR